MPKKYNDVKILKVRKNATLREIHRESKKQFTAADLARFCQDEPTVPAEQVLAELEAIYEKEMRRYKNSKNKKKRIQHGLVQKRSFLNHSEEG
jgi:thymidylate synthase ThyX